MPFSQALGVTEDRGAIVAGAKIVPVAGLTLGAIDYTIPDTLNTAFAELDWIFPQLACGVQLRLSGNYTDQRTIGEELMPGSPFETSQVSGRVAASYHDATILAANRGLARIVEIELVEHRIGREAAERAVEIGALAVLGDARPTISHVSSPMG